MKLKIPKLDFLNYFRLQRPLMVWLVGGALFVAGVEIAWLKGVIQSIYSSDVTKLSVVIALIFSWQSFVAFREAIYQTQKIKLSNESKDQIERGWLWSDIILSLGMIGTVTGFMIMLAGFVDVDFSDFDSVQGLITRLSAGMSTSLSTTLVGLIASVLLKLQFFSLERIVENKKSKKLVL